MLTAAASAAASLCALCNRAPARCTHPTHFARLHLVQAVGRSVCRAGGRAGGHLAQEPRPAPGRGGVMRPAQTAGPVPRLRWQRSGAAARLAQRGGSHWRQPPSNPRGRCGRPSRSTPGGGRLECCWAAGLEHFGRQRGSATLNLGFQQSRQVGTDCAKILSSKSGECGPTYSVKGL